MAVDDLAKHYKVLGKTLFTEKVTNMQANHNTWALKVRRDANKVQIRKAVEAIFDVRVLDVRTQTVPGKIKRIGMGHGRTPTWKKAIVKLAEGDSIGQV